MSRQVAADSASTSGLPAARPLGAQLEAVSSESSRGAARSRVAAAGAICSHLSLSVAAAARLMSAHRIDRLPVLDADRCLVGIVTRADLVRAFVRPDSEIAAEIWRDVLEPYGITTDDVVAVVDQGDVVLDGVVERIEDLESLAAAVGAIPGVVRVRDRLRLRAGATPPMPSRSVSQRRS